MKHLPYYLLVLLLFVACREEEKVVPSEQTDTGGAVVRSDILGMYLLNEGNMGSNKATLDYLDLSGSEPTARYHRNIYAERNPGAVMQLGDVGNDAQIYGSRLWLVINCSNKVEVANAGSATRIGQVDIPNCRYLAFQGKYAYVSSYVGAPAAAPGDTPLGMVFKIDTLTLQRAGSVAVGYQPEEMAIVDGRLYVANSGGYRKPHYDRTVSVVDLATMKEERKIDVAINLHRLRADRYGQLWVTSRGDYDREPSRIFWLEQQGGRMKVGGRLDVCVSDLCIVGDSLYFYGSQWNEVEQKNTVTYGIINVRTHQVVSTSLSSAPELGQIKMPFGIIVNPVGKDFYLMDAKNYTSSGELLHFKADGSFDWKVWTGDIPGHAVFLRKASVAADAEPIAPPPGPPAPVDPSKYSKYIQAVDEYVPAPGQHVNESPAYEPGDTPESMARKCTALIGGDARRLISLGGFGGYITFHFDHPIANVEGERDFAVWGNAYQEMKNLYYGGMNEAGVVMVSKDVNGNGRPDDAWYELSGSCDADSTGLVDYGYEITYRRNAMGAIPWTDNRGGSGTIDRLNQWHAQEYYPQWLPDGLTFRGTRLPRNGWDSNGQGNYWVLLSFRYGYADNHPNMLGDFVTPNTEGCGMDIGWAVDDQRRPVALDCIDFVRVYTGLNQKCGWLGETSTEIQGAEDLHLEKSLGMMKGDR